MTNTTKLETHIRNLKKADKSLEKVTILASIQTEIEGLISQIAKTIK